MRKISRRHVSVLNLTSRKVKLACECSEIDVVSKLIPYDCFPELLPVSIVGSGKVEFDKDRVVEESAWLPCLPAEEEELPATSFCHVQHKLESCLARDTVSS